MQLEVEISSYEKCDTIFIGSVLEGFLRKKIWLTRDAWWLGLFRQKVIVWGAGFIQDSCADEKLFRRLDVRACRGLSTLGRLRKLRGVKVAENVVIADPGLLVGRFIDTSQVKKKYELGVIPHYLHKADPLLSNIKVKNTTVIDIQQSPEAFMRVLAQCKNIISSSLHGLIAADSLGIPNVRMTLVNELLGGHYKFDDYYTAFELDSHTIIDLTRREFTDADLPSIKNGYKITAQQVTQLQSALIDSFPYK